MEKTQEDVRVRTRNRSRQRRRRIIREIITTLLILAGLFGAMGAGYLIR
jgi:hypothetical protein